MRQKSATDHHLVVVQVKANLLVVTVFDMVAIARIYLLLKKVTVQLLYSQNVEST